MKQKFMIFLGAFLLVAFFASGDKAATVKAAGDFTNPELKITQVEDISVFNDYSNTKNNIGIDTIRSDCQDGHFIYKFSIPEDGYISLLITCRDIDKIIEKYAKTYTRDLTDATVTATVYRDAGLLYPVTPVVTAKGLVKGESAGKIALDKGTYYVGIVVEKYSNTTTNGTTIIVSCIGTGELIIYYQPVECYEQYRPSMVGTENDIDLETNYKGILTVTNPKDYYKFELTEKALVKINCMYSSLNPLKFTLYSTEREELLTKSIAGNSVWYNVEKYLEPGTYYFSLETTKQYDGGATSILIDPTIYPLTLEQVNQSSDSYVTVTTIDDPQEICYVLGKLTNSELTSAKWKKGKIITDTLLFGVNKVGYYTVRVTDQYGNMFMQSIKVSKCDTKAPDAPKIKTCAVDTFVITGTAEKNSLVTVNVNGKIYTCTATSKGAFKCILPAKLVKGSSIEVTAQDISGNVSEKTELLLE